MRKFWTRDEDAELGRRLAAARPEPCNTFLDELVHRVEVTSAEQPVQTRRRFGVPRFALAGIVTASMVVMLAAFGGAGYAKSGVSQAAHSTSHSVKAVFSNEKPKQHGNEHGGNGKSDKGNGHHQASHHTYPHPGFYCATKGSKVRIKLIIFQERYDRLIARGFVIGPGPFASGWSAKRACQNAAAGHEDDDD